MNGLFFREHDNLPHERRERSFDGWDIAFAGGVLATVVGLAMVWLPLALIVPGTIVAAIAVIRAFR